MLSNVSRSLRRDFISMVLRETPVKRLALLFCLFSVAETWSEEAPTITEKKQATLFNVSVEVNFNYRNTGIPSAGSKGQDDVTANGMNAYQNDRPYNGALGAGLNFFPFRGSFGLQGNIFTLNSAWVSINPTDCSKYLSSDRCADKRYSSLFFTLWGYEIGPIYRYDIYQIIGLSKNRFFLDINPGLYFEQLNFTSLAEALLNQSLPTQNSYSWYIRSQLTWYLGGADSIGLFLSIGGEVRSSNIRLPGINENLNGTMGAFIVRIGYGY